VARKEIPMRRVTTIVVLALCTLLCVSISSAQQTSTTATTTTTSVPNLTHYDGALKDAQSAAIDSKTVGLAAAVNPFPFTTGDGIFAAPWGGSIRGLNEIFIFGLEHMSLGNATLSKIPPPNATGTPSLLVSNIGTGGGDGVLASFLPNTAYLDAYFDGIGSAQSYSPGSFFQGTSMGTINGVPNQIVATARETAMGLYWGITFDFSRISDGPLLAIYSLGGLPVAIETINNPSGAQWETTTGSTTSAVTAACPDCDPPWNANDWYVDWNKGGAYIVSPTGNAFLVDGLDVAAINLDVTFGGYSGMSLTASGIPSFTITNETSFVNSGGGATLFSDLVGGGATVYQCCAGLPVSGTGPVGTSFTQANLFTSTASGSVSQIDLAIGYAGGTNTFYASILTDNGGLPGTELWNQQNLSSSQTVGGCCGLVTITGITGLTLTAGQQYFVVLGRRTSAPPPQKRGISTARVRLDLFFIPATVAKPGTAGVSRRSARLTF
jgi:hypothetical protein